MFEHREHFMTTNFKKGKIGQKQFGQMAIFLLAKRFSKKPNSTNWAKKRPSSVPVPERAM